LQVEEEVKMEVEEMDGDGDNEEVPFGFPIQDTVINVHIKNIPPYVLPNFNGMRSKYP